MMARWVWLAGVALGAGLVPAAVLAQDATGGAGQQAGAHASESDPLAVQFADPPAAARPRVWWHWLNGNVTLDGIVKDMDWMVRAGIGGLQNFDVDLNTPVIVDRRLVYMTPEWKAAFRLAAQEAERRGLELAIAASPGWSETGGPWVAPKDGLKKLVWSETRVSGGRRFAGKIAPPPGVTGAFQDLPYHDAIAAIAGGAPKAPPQLYQDIAVLAVPARSAALPAPAYADGAGKPLDAAALSDASLATGIDLPRGSAEAPTSVTMTYPAAVTVRSATFLVPGAKGIFSGATLLPRLEASENGTDWRAVADIPVSEVPTTVSFAGVTARHFRVVMPPAPFSGSNLGDPAPGIAPPPFVTGMAAAAQAPVRLVQLVLDAEPRVDRFESKAGFALERDYYALGAPDAATSGAAPDQVIDLTDKLRPDGSLDWTPSKGEWEVIRIGASLLGTTNHPAPAEATGLEVDKFDGAAVEAYLRHYIGMYRDAAGPDLIGAAGVRAILTDSIEVGAANWTPQMLARFKALRGYDARPWLPALTGTIIGTREQSDRFLYDWRRTLADLMASDHYGTVARVAREHGLKVYGEALEDGRPSLGDDMAMRRHTDVPMAAMWTFSRSAGPKPSYLADIKGAASVAHVYGQNLVAAESMTSALAYWAYSPRDLRRIIDLEFVTGVNRPVIHTSVHSPGDAKAPGLSLMIFGQYFNRHETWAEMARPWMDYMARTSLLLQRGRYFADVAYFYGEEAPLTGLYANGPVADAPVSNAYDFVNVDALVNVLANDGAELVAPSGARYKALYLGGSSRRMTLGVLRRIAALAEGGATVVGEAPQASPSLMDAGQDGEWRALVARLWPGSGDARVGQGRVIAWTAIEPALRRLGVGADFAFTGGQPGADIPFLHRRDGADDYYFVVNRQNRDETIEARFAVTGKAPELWHADTGQREPLSFRVENGQTVVPLALGAEKSALVVFREPTTDRARTLAKPTLRALGTLAGAWDVAFQPGRGAPAKARLAQLAPLNSHADPAIRYFSGEATYTRSFATPAGWRAGQPLWLDLGQVDDLAEVSVNGRTVGTVWQAPYRIDVSAAIKPGQNVLAVKVANLWVNRLVGDAQPGAKPITWTAIPTYTAAAPLRSSGLIGPVTLLGQ